MFKNCYMLNSGFSKKLDETKLKIWLFLRVLDILAVIGSANKFKMIKLRYVSYFLVLFQKIKFKTMACSLY